MSDVDNIKTFEGLVGYTVANVDMIRDLLDKHKEVLLSQKEYNDKLHEEINVLSEGLEAVIIAQGEMLDRLDEIEYKLNKMAFIEEDNDYEY